MIKYITAVFLLTLSSMSFAHSDEQHNDKDKQAIIDIIASIKYGWGNGDGTPFRKNFLDFTGARYIEGDNRSFAGPMLTNA